MLRKACTKKLLVVANLPNITLASGGGLFGLHIFGVSVHFMNVLLRSEHSLPEISFQTFDLRFFFYFLIFEILDF